MAVAAAVLNLASLWVPTVASEPLVRFWNGLDSRIEWWEQARQSGYRASYSIESLQIDFEKNVAKAPECRFDIRMAVHGFNYRVEIKAIRINGGNVGETVTWANVFGRDDQTAWMFDVKSGDLYINSERVYKNSNLLLPLLPEYSPSFPLMRSVSDLRFDRDASDMTDPLEDFLGLPQIFAPSKVPIDPEKALRKITPLPNLQQGAPLDVRIREWHLPGANDEEFAKSPFIHFRLELQSKPSEEIFTATYVGNPTYPSHSVMVMSEWLAVQLPDDKASIQLPRLMRCETFSPDVRSPKPKDTEVLAYVFQSKLHFLTFGFDAEEFIMPVDQAAKIIDLRTGKPLARP